MTTGESKGRFFLQNESIRIDSHDVNRIESIRIANWNALLTTCWEQINHTAEPDE